MAQIFSHSMHVHKGVPDGSVGKETACYAGDKGHSSLIPGSRKSPGEGNGSPLQYSCLENPLERESWWATVHAVAESDITDRLNNNKVPEGPGRPLTSQRQKRNINSS